MKSKFFIIFLVLLLAGLLLAGCNPPPLPGGTTPPTGIPYDLQDTPDHLVASTINAINLQDFQRAYDYWEDNPLSLPDFIAHYADVDHIQAVVREPLYTDGAAGSLYSLVPTLQLTTYTDGTLHVFYGCYTARRINSETAGHPTKWYIYSSTETEVADADPWSALNACPDFLDSAPLTSEWEYDTPEHLLGSYVYAITHREYHTAYDYWEMPPFSYPEFIARYLHTERMDLLVALPVREDGTAGSLYAKVPTLMLETKTDGTKHVFRTCFVTRRSTVEPDAHWMIYEATTTPLNAWILADGCN